MYLDATVPHRYKITNFLQVFVLLIELVYTRRALTAHFNIDVATSRLDQL